MATGTESTFDTLNSLMRGELSACETYQQVTAKFGTGPGAVELQEINEEDVQAANELGYHVQRSGGNPDQNSGSWGGLARAVEGVAKLFGRAAVLASLKEAEEIGVNCYERALKHAGLPEQCRRVLGGRLIPQTRSHVAPLDGLMGAT